MSLLQQVDGGVMTLTLNRPEVHNAFDDRLISDLLDSLDWARNDRTVRAVVLTGSGPSFSTGADLNWMGRMVAATLEENERDALQLARLMRHLNYLPVPTIARVNGHAFGGGVGLIACCDIAISVTHAQFGLTEARLGLAPAVISPYVYRRIGESNTRRYFLTAERFDAARGADIGLIHEVVPATQLDEVVEKQLNLILATGPQASGYCKNLAFAVAGHTSDAQKEFDEYSSKLIAKLRVDDEGQEGLRAFLEKRIPGWVDGSEPDG